MSTLQKIIDLFLGEYKESTRRSYKSVLKRMRDFVGPSRTIDEIESHHLIEYMQSVDARPTVQSPATYNKHARTIRTFFNWCIKAGFIQPPSPARALKLHRQKKRIDRDKAMPEESYEQLLDFAKWTPRYHALVIFLGDTGCRIGGAAALRWSDIKFDERTAQVTEKGRPARPVYFGEDCAKALRRWKSQCTNLEGEHVFHKHGRRLTNDSLGQLFSRICTRANIGTYGPHSLRHRKGHQLADNKVAPSIAAKALGHQNIITTLEYYYPEDWKRVQEEMAKLAHKSEPSNILPLERKSGDTS